MKEHDKHVRLRIPIVPDIASEPRLLLRFHVTHLVRIW